MASDRIDQRWLALVLTAYAKRLDADAAQADLMDAVDSDELYAMADRIGRAAVRIHEDGGDAVTLG